MMLFRKKTKWVFLNLLLKILILINALVLAKIKDDEEDRSIKVSIVIPTYNAAPFLERCINSALNQTLQEIEVIVVNDKSTDNTEEILKKYDGEKKFKSVTLEKNQGQSVARNTGIEMAHGEFIGFIDSDDLVDLDFFENLYKLSKDKDVVIGIFVNSTNDTNKFSHHRKLYKYDCVGNSIWRKSFLDEKKIRFEKGVKMAEDVHFRERAYKSKPRRIEAPDVGSYYYYKCRVGSLMHYNEDYVQFIFDESKKEHAEKLNSIDSFNKSKEENIRYLNEFDSLMNYIKNHIVAIAVTTVSFTFFLASVIFVIHHHYNKQIKLYVS